MKIRIGDGTSKYGPGVEIELTGDEVATAVDAYLAAHRVYVYGPRTVIVNDDLCETGRILVDPSGHVCAHGMRFRGTGEVEG